MELMIYKARIDPSMTSDLEVNYIGLVDRPAIERNFQAFNEQKKKAAFILNEEKRIISGPAMIADMPIYRKDVQLGEYYVVFDKLAIQTIVEKFSAKGYLKNFNLFHDQQQQVSDVTIFNSFVSDSELGVPAMAGFEDCADGSWFISAKVNNPIVWEAVKAGSIKGFSVEGLFSYVPVTAQQMASSNDLTTDECCFLNEAICNCQETLQAAILIGKDSSLYDLAQSIITSQSDDIAKMKALLDKGLVTPEMGIEWAMRRIGKTLNETKVD